MKNVKIELVKKIGSLPYFVVTSDEPKATEAFCFIPGEEEKAKAKAIKYAQELRDATEYETRTKIEF